jgi:probable blue pigment (indigoidine) exporter
MPYLIALIAPLTWGSTYALVSLSLEGLSPFWVACWRALPAGLLLVLLRPRLPDLAWRKLLLLAFCNIAAFFTLLFIGAYRLPGAVAGTLGATLPLILLLLAWLIDGARPTLRWLLLALLGLCGVLLLLNPSARLDPVGVAAALGAALLIGLSARWMQSWSVGDLLSLTGWQLLLGGLMLIPIAWTLAGPMPLPTAHALPGLAYLVLVNTALAYWAWLWGLRRLGAQVMSMLALTNPIVAVSLGVLLVGETLGPMQWSGIALILLSLVLMKLPLRRR